MGFMAKLLFVAITGLAVYVGLQVSSLLRVPPLPKLENTWWGPGKASKDDTSIKPFKIDVSNEVLVDLKTRLSQSRPLTPSLEGAQQHYGINKKLLEDIVDFWKTKYNWREREQFFNKYPQFTTVIQGLKIHYLHVKPTSTTNIKVLPLLLLHGWPGSVREFYEIIPLLTTPQKGNDFVFEVITPSLPGYGFSQAASKPGLGPVQVAVVFKNLMERLGFNKYYLQGGDWGALIVSNMATLYPQKVLGVHSNMCFVNSPLSNLKLFLGSFYPSLVVDKKHESKMYPLSKVFSGLMLEMGYMHIQATKPDTVGVALNDSPVGLAAYIIEKFTTWTNTAWKDRLDGGLQEKFTYTDLLDNVMIYWVTGSITTSVRLYSEAFNKEQFSLQMDRIPIEVPSACIRFTHELAYLSDFILQEKYKYLVHLTDSDDGGHFAAFEVPNILANDIWLAVKKFRSFKKTQ